MLEWLWILDESGRTRKEVVMVFLSGYPTICLKWEPWSPSVLPFSGQRFEHGTPPNRSRSATLSTATLYNLFINQYQTRTFRFLKKKIQKKKRRSEYDRSFCKLLPYSIICFPPAREMCVLNVSTVKEGSEYFFSPLSSWTSVLNT